MKEDLVKFFAIIIGLLGFVLLFSFAFFPESAVRFASDLIATSTVTFVAWLAMKVILFILFSLSDISIASDGSYRRGGKFITKKENSILSMSPIFLQFAALMFVVVILGLQKILSDDIYYQIVTYADISTLQPLAFIGLVGLCLIGVVWVYSQIK